MSSLFVKSRFILFSRKNEAKKNVAMYGILHWVVKIIQDIKLIIRQNTADNRD